MKLETILVPVDPQRRSGPLLSLVERMANRLDLRVILLRVIDLKILAPESRIYDEVVEEAYKDLRRLARQYLSDAASFKLDVRFGKCAEEILSAAQRENVDSIFLPNYGPSLWKRLRFVWKASSNPNISSMVEKVLSEAECDVFIVNSKNPSQANYLKRGCQSLIPAVQKPAR